MEATGTAAETAGARQSEALAATGAAAKTSADEVEASSARSSEALVATGVAAGSAAGGVEEAGARSSAALDDVATKASASGDVIEGALAGGGVAAGKATDEIEKGGSKAETALASVGSKAESSSKSLTKFGNWGTAAVVGIAAGVVDLGVKFQSATTAMAAAGDIPIQTANAIGKAFLNSGDDVIFSAKEQEGAYGSVVGQLSTLKGYTDSAATAAKFMSTSMDLAEESGSQLGSTTADLSKLMQTFQIPIKDVGSASTDLFNASRLTGTGIDQVSSSLSTLKSRLGVTAPSLSALSSLSVDFAEHGLSGSKALRQVNTAMNALLKPQNDLLVDNLKLNQATQDLPPSLQTLAQQYDSNTISTTQLTTATEAMTPAQQQAWTAFTAASGAVIKAKDAVQLTGITVDNAKGQFVGMGNVITQVDAKLKGHTQAQQLAILSTILGATANKALLNTFLAGAAGYDKATTAVTNHKSASNALAVQQKTLGHEFEATKVEVEDLATRVGVDLVPKLEVLAADGGKVLSFFEKNKDAAKALAIVVGGVLTAAVAVFAEQKITKLISGLKSISGELGTLGQKAGAAAEKFLGLGGAAENTTTKLQTEGAAAQEAGSKTSAAGTAAGTAATETTGPAGAAGAAGAEGTAAESAGTLTTAADALTASAGDLSSAAEALSGTAATQDANAENDAGLNASDSADLSSAAEDLVGAASDLGLAGTKLVGGTAAESAGTLSTTAEALTSSASALSSSAADLVGAASDLVVAATRLELVGGGPTTVVPSGKTPTEPVPVKTPGETAPGETAPAEFAPTQAASAEVVPAAAGAAEATALTVAAPKAGGLFAEGFFKGSLSTGIGGLIGVQLYNAFLEKDVGKIIGTKAASVIGDTATGASLGMAVAGPVGAVVGGLLGAVFSQRKDFATIAADNRDIARDKKENVKNEYIIQAADSPKVAAKDISTNEFKIAAEKQLIAADQMQEWADAVHGVPDKELKASVTHLQASVSQQTAANLQISADAIRHANEVKFFSYLSGHDKETSATAKESKTAANSTSTAAIASTIAAADHKVAAQDTSKAAADLTKASNDLASGNTKAAGKLETSAENLNKAASNIITALSGGTPSHTTASTTPASKHVEVKKEPTPKHVESVSGLKTEPVATAPAAPRIEVTTTAAVPATTTAQPTAPVPVGISGDVAHILQHAGETASGAADKGVAASTVHLHASTTHLSAANAQVAATKDQETRGKKSSDDATTAAKAITTSATASSAAAADHKLAAQDTSKAASDMTNASKQLLSGNTTAANQLETAAAGLETAAAALKKEASTTPTPTVPVHSVPKHAEGGVATSPQFGEFGEAGPEALLPLSNPSTMAEIAQAIVQAGGAGGGLAAGHQTIYQIDTLTIVAQNPAQMEQQLAQKARVSALSSRPSGSSNLAVAT
jgi:hypothetical protein